MEGSAASEAYNFLKNTCKFKEERARKYETIFIEEHLNTLERILKIKSAEFFVNELNIPEHFAEIIMEAIN